MTVAIFKFSETFWGYFAISLYILKSLLCLIKPSLFSSACTKCWAQLISNSLRKLLKERNVV